MALTLIHGTTPPDTPKQRAVNRIKKADKPAQMVQCPRCGGRDLLELRSGALLKNRRVVGGTKQTVCACCYVKGERVILA